MFILPYIYVYETVTGGVFDMKTKRNIFALIALGLSALYILYIIYIFITSLVFNNSLMLGNKAWGEVDNMFPDISIYIFLYVFIPHFFLTILGTVFNAIGFFKNKRKQILIGGILYGSSILLFSLFFQFVIIQTVLSFIAFYKMSPKTPEV